MKKKKQEEKNKSENNIRYLSKKAVSSSSPNFVLKVHAN